LRLVIQNNTGASCDLVDMAHLLQEIEFNSPSGQQIQLIRGDELYDLLVRYYSNDEWPRIARMINSNNQYGRGKIIPNGVTRTFFLPLLGCFLENCGIYVPAVDGDLNCYIRFKQSSASVVSGSAPTLLELNLDCQVEQLDSKKRSHYIQRYRSKVHHYYYPFVRRQTITQTLSANTKYSLNLSSIKGDVVFIDFRIRESLVGNRLRDYAPIASFNYYNNEGDQLLGQNDISSDFNRLIMQPNYFPSGFSENNNIFTGVFPIEDSAPIHLIMNGSKLGSYPFTTYERLEFTTTGAGVNEVQRCVVAGGVGASGTYFINWQTPFGVESTPALAYNSTTAQIKSAIEALQSFDGTVTVGATLDQIVNPVTFTFSGNYGFKELFNNNYKLIVRNNSVQTGLGIQFQYDNIIVTSGQTGINSGASHTIDIVAYTTSLLELGTNGSIMIKNN